MEIDRQRGATMCLNRFKKSIFSARFLLLLIVYYNDWSMQIHQYKQKNALSDKFEPNMRAVSVKGYSRQAIDSFLLPAGVFANRTRYT